MSVARKKIKDAFIDWVVPVLTVRGFRGVFPNYRRHTDQQIDIVSLQFSLFDEAFCISIAKCPTDGLTYSNGDRIPGNWLQLIIAPADLCLGQKVAIYHIGLNSIPVAMS